MRSPGRKVDARRRRRGRRHRSDAAEQWVVWPDRDRELEWIESELLAMQSLADVAPRLRPRGAG